MKNHSSHSSIVEKEIYAGHGTLKVETPQAAVLDAVMIKAMFRVKDTVPTALSLKINNFDGHGDMKGRKLPGCCAGCRDD